MTLLLGCKTENYTITGKCDVLPTDNKVSLCLLDDKFEDVIINRTEVDSQGYFCFKGNVDEPCIIYVIGEDSDGYQHWYSMGILEEGNIVLNCADYRVYRNIFDCQGSGTPLNNLIQEFYKKEREVALSVRESERIDNSEYVQTLYDYPSVEKFMLKFVEENKDNMAGVLVTLGALYSDTSKIERFPLEIRDNSIIQGFIKQRK